MQACELKYEIPQKNLFEKCFNCTLQKQENKLGSACDYQISEVIGNDKSKRFENRLGKPLLGLYIEFKTDVRSKKTGNYFYEAQQRFGKYSRWHDSGWYLASKQCDLFIVCNSVNGKQTVILPKSLKRVYEQRHLYRKCDITDRRKKLDHDTKDSIAYLVPCKHLDDTAICTYA